MSGEYVIIKQNQYMRIFRKAGATDYRTAKTLEELGAQPLVMSRPFNGLFWNTQGVTSNDRNVYYDKLTRLVAPYHVLLVDFKDHDEDKYFNIDTSSHSSPKGWIYVDKALDAFYQGNLH